jgi:hypothetical protein
VQVYGNLCAGGEGMNGNQPTENRACLMNCEQQYRECLLQGNDEVYCRIQRVPCDSSCN